MTYKSKHLFGALALASLLVNPIVAGGSREPGTNQDPVLTRWRGSRGYVINPNGIYGSYNLNYWFPIVTGSVTDESGENVVVEQLSTWFELVVDVMTGDQPLEYYDEWLRFYYDHGGDRWEEHATRIYME